MAHRAPILRTSWPWTLWRSTFLELWRLVILSSVVLVSVLALAASVRYIADGRLGPVEAVIFISWGLLPMLQYALPFAGGFGATLAYHRMAQDNELVAAGGGGVSHRAILAPAIVSGLILGLLLLTLTSRVIPWQLYRMERMVFLDISRVVHASLDHGQTFERDGMMIRADSVRRLGPDPERGIYERLSLTGVAAIERDEHGAIIGEATASHALVAFAQVDGPALAPEPGGRTPRGGPWSGEESPSAPLVTRISLVLRNAHRTGDRWGRAVAESLPIQITVPEFLHDKPKYLSNRELARLPRNPDRLNHIDNMRRDLARALATQQVMRDLAARIDEEGRIELAGPGAGEQGHIYSIRAERMEFDAGLDAWALLPGAPAGSNPGQPLRVEIDRYDPALGAARAGTHFAAARVFLRADASHDPLQSRTGLTLLLHEARVRSAGSEAAGERPIVEFTGLAPPRDPLPELLERSSHDMIAEARERVSAGEADESARRRADNLESRLERLGREVIGKLHERWASSAASLVMVLAGAITAMRLGASLPLTVYLWSFFPALLAVMTISAGEHMTHKMGLSGLFVLWSGVGILALYTLAAFLLVRRH